jgi:hypothetical protein
MLLRDEDEDNRLVRWAKRFGDGRLNHHSLDLAETSGQYSRFVYAKFEIVKSRDERHQPTSRIWLERVKFGL